IRLRFVADNWRIDFAAVAPRFARPLVRSVPVTRVVARTTNAWAVDSAALRAIGEADDRYLETQPGQRMRLEFALPAELRGESPTSYLIAWQGYYREWVRGSW